MQQSQSMPAAPAALPTNCAVRAIAVHHVSAEQNPAVQEHEPGLLSTNELLIRVGKGEPSAFEAFEAFYDRTARQVFSAVRAVVYDRAQSEEVTQEVFVELWRTAARFDPQIAGAQTWALMLAHRRAVDRVRSAQASVNRESRWGQLQSRAVFDDDLADAAKTASDGARVRKALSTLSNLQREAICLAYFEGRTYAEVATLLGLPLGTVKTRMRDGLIKLRSELVKKPEGCRVGEDRR